MDIFSTIILAGKYFPILVTYYTSPVVLKNLPFYNKKSFPEIYTLRRLHAWINIYHTTAHSFQFQKYRGQYI